MKLFYCFMLCALSMASAAMDCDIPNGIAKAQPTVKVGVANAKDFDPGTCAVLTFELKEKPKSNGKAFLPTKVKVYSSNNKKFAKGAKKSVKKWFFLAKNVERDGQYYGVLKAN